MKKVTNSTFSEGLLMDLNPLVLPQTYLSDCLNGTIITYNGNEFTLQTDLGNVKLEHAKIPKGYIPLGSKEYGGILYLALYNPENNMCEIGSIPSPNYNVNPNKAGDGIIHIDSNELISGDEDNSYDFKSLFLKLFEFEQMELNPGDEYVLGYSVNTENSTDIFNKADNPLYSVKLYAISKENKQHELDDLNVIKLDDISKEPDSFKFFNNTVSSILALSVKINQINWFEGVVYEVDEGVKFQFYGKNRLNKDDASSDDLYIRGCKIEYSYKRDGADVSKTIYVGDLGAELTFNHTYLLTNEDSGLKSGDVVTFEITPYDQYTYIEDLKRKLTIKMGEKYDPSFANTVFKYKYSSENKSLRLDFNIPTIGMVKPYMYVEFYDIWSDYSIIIPVEDINPAGSNTVFIDTIKEALEDEYILTDGGTPKSVIHDFTLEGLDDSSKIYRPFLSNRVRNTQNLREDNLYLVRISIIDSNNKDVNNLSISDYINDYKFLIVNTNYNEKYDKSVESNVPSVDFNTFNLNNNIDIDFNTKIVGLIPNISKTIDGGFTVTTEEDSKNYYYKIEDSENVIEQSESIVNNNKASTTGRIEAEISTIRNTFGKSVLNNDYSVSLVKDFIEIFDEDLSVDSSYHLDINNKDLELTLNTARKINADITHETRTSSFLSEKVFLVDSFLKYMRSISNFSLYLGGDKNLDFPRIIYKRTRGIASQPFGDEVGSEWEGINSNTMTDVLNKLDVSGAILSLYGSIDGKAIKLLEANGGKSFQYQDEWVIVMRTKDGSSVCIMNTNKQKSIDIMNDLYYPLYTEQPKYLYYYTNVRYDKESTTKLAGSVVLNLSANIEFSQNVNKVPINNTQDVLTSLKSLMIERGITDYDIESTDYFTLNDLNINKEITFDVPNLSITDGSDLSLKNKLVDSKSDLFENNSEIVNPLPISDKLKSLSGNYDAYTNKFSAEYLDGKTTFRYNPEILLNTTVWSEEKKRAIDVDKKPFDEY